MANDGFLFICCLVTYMDQPFSLLRPNAGEEQRKGGIIYFAHGFRGFGP
jgi:hypothetical protein